MKIKSVFEQIAQEVFVSKNLKSSQEFIVRFVGETQIKDSDKMIIMDNVSKCKNLGALQKYICNSLLKYEGMGVI